MKLILGSLAAGILALGAWGSSAMAAGVPVTNAILKRSADSATAAPADRSVEVAPVGWRRAYYGPYRPYAYRPYYAPRPYYAYRPYYAPYVAPYGYYGGPAYYRGPYGW